ncbi:MAG: MFS transporter, partial [Promethearchaeota archaeon]
LGNFSWTILGGIFLLTYVDFFYDDLGLSDGYFNLALIIYAIINSINDPLLSIMSDRTDRKRWGSRRLIYIRWGGLFWCIFFVITWFPWSYDNQLIMFFHFLISISMFDIGLSLVISCWMALLPEIAPDVNQRVKLSYIVGIITIIAGIFVIIFASTKDFGIPIFQVMSIFVAIICFVLFYLVSIFVKEREEYVDDKPLPFFKGIIETVKSKSFMIYVGYNFFFVVNTSIGIAYVFIYQLITPLNLMGFYLIMVFNSTVANYLGMRFQRNMGIRGVILKFGIFKVILGILFYFLSLMITQGQLGLLVPLIGYLIVSFLGGIMGGFNHTLMTLSMDEDELRTGVRRENTFLGVNALFTKPGDSIGPLIATLILGITNYVRDSPATLQPDVALVGIKTIFLLIPAVFTTISLIFMYFYPIHGEYKTKIYDEIEQLHQKKRDQLTEKYI